jgi:hypothetical protein
LFVYDLVGQADGRFGGAEEDGVHAYALAKEHVAKVVAHHYAFGKVDAIVVFFGLERHADVWFAVVVVVVDGGAGVYLVYPAAMLGDGLLHVLVYAFEVVEGHDATAYAALVGNDDDFAEYFGKLLYGCKATFVKFEFLPVGNVCAGNFLVDNAVTV